MFRAGDDALYGRSAVRSRVGTQTLVCAVTLVGLTGLAQSQPQSAALAIDQWTTPTSVGQVERPASSSTLCWRRLPKQLRGLQTTPLQALTANPTRNVIAVRTQICLERPQRLQLQVQTSAEARIAINTTVVASLSRTTLRSTAPQHLQLRLKKGCHTLTAALKEPRGRLRFGWWLKGRRWKIQPTSTDEQCVQIQSNSTQPSSVVWLQEKRVQRLLSQTKKQKRRSKALGQLVSLMQTGALRGPTRAPAIEALRKNVSIGPEIALWVANRHSEIGDRITAINEARQRWPEDLELRIALIKSLMLRGQLRRAAVLAAPKTNQPPNAALCAVRAELWHELDMHAAAYQMARHCVRAHPRAADPLTTLSRLALAYDDLDTHLQTTQQSMLLKGSSGDRWLDVIAAKIEKGLPLGESTITDRPQETDFWGVVRARNSIGLAMINGGSYAKALDILNRIPTWARHGFTAELRARALIGKSRSIGPGAESARLHRAAVAELRRAIRLAPGRQDLQARLRLWLPSAQFFEPYAGHLLQKAQEYARHAPPRRALTQPLVRQVIRQLGQGRYLRYVAEVYKIGTKGPQQHQLQMHHVPTQSTLEILEAAVIRCKEQCTIQRQVERHQAALYEPDVALYYDEEETTLTFNNLKPGDVVVMAYLTRDFAIDPFSHVFGELFQVGDEWPIDHYHLVLELLDEHKPNSALRQVARPKQPATIQRNVLRSAGTVTEAQNRWSVWTWQRRNAPATPVEAKMPGAAQAVDTLHVSGYRSWAAVAQAYAPLIRSALPKAQARDRLETLSKQVTQNADKPRDKIEALYRWISDKIRYVGLEFGEHSLRPHSVSKVLQRGFGDCKDKSTLLVAMLQTLGIKGQVALVRVAEDGALTDGVASLGVFNHAVVYVPKFGLWLDPTVELHMSHELPSGDVAGQALPIALQGGQKSLMKMPNATADTNAIEDNWTITLTPSGGALIQIRQRAKGLLAAQLRKVLHTKNRRELHVQEQLEPLLPGVRVNQVQVTGVSPLLREVQVVISAQIDQIGLLTQGKWSWRPFVRGPNRLPSRVRFHPHVSEFNWSRRWNIKLQSDPVGAWRFAAQSYLSGHSMAGSQWSVRVKASEGGGVLLSRSQHRTSRSITRQAYGAWRKQQMDFRRACGVEVSAQSKETK